MLRAMTPRERSLLSGLWILVVILATRSSEGFFWTTPALPLFFGGFFTYCTEACSGNWVERLIARIDKRKEATQIIARFKLHLLTSII
jgi:hypothetical protein